ncbi:hypothetical protein [Polyangium mundeleinium]|uniref:Uncharacterized protein n=1 Tax=Polyangium mundeleinium TaxID=2995306 RepID=A0ABT5FAA6_9BACT|nr:hypothetical protein [Polyangium mundeleinium]MDC0750056.1 hypothetical protein [Polyangium mundeleinium]
MPNQTKSKNPMRNQVAIRKLVAEIVGCRQGSIVVQADLSGGNHIGINWPESMTADKDRWNTAKAMLEAEYPGFVFYYS